MISIKKCGTCKKIYPKTEEYFFVRVIKQKLSDGSLVEYRSFRSDCKKCHGAKGEKRRIENRSAELGCNPNEYHKHWKKQISKIRTIYPEIVDIPEGKRCAVLKKIRSGYKYTTYEQYKKDCSLNKSMSSRKYDYGNAEKVTWKMANKKTLQVMTDARIALIMGLSVKEVPKEIIESKRLLIMLKREMGLTHKTKKLI